MNLTVTPHGDCRIIRIEGRLDGITSPQLEREIIRLCDEGHHRLAFELDALEYVSSAGLRVLLLAVKKTRAAGGKIALYGVGDAIREVLEISGFLSLFPVLGTKEEALDSLA
jgi:anti-sigma B factor antagonist/stage II sporulation protein AA (anti-sigma F factor antagonist)